MRKGSQGLTKVLRGYALLLLERGESIANICRALNGLVEERTIRTWREKWRLANGKPSSMEINGERLPVPPYDWNSITEEVLSNVNDLGNSSASARSGGAL